MRNIVSIGDMIGFRANVFGAEDLLKHWPELRDSGVTIRREPNGMYYILDEGEGVESDCGFFTGEELKYLKFDKDVPFRSYAEWPPGTLNGYNNDVSTDDHHGPDPHRMAVAVCAGLERDGFGGEGKIKPLTTWIEPI